MSRKAVAFPGWSSNPYINQLYLAPRSAGWQVSTPRTVDELQSMASDLVRGDVLHVHWLAPVFTGAADDDAGRLCAEAFCDLLDELMSRGVRLFWTVHNVVSHDSSMYEHEVAVSAFLAERAEIVFVLNEATVSVTAPHYAIPPEKCRLLKHSSYLGIYPDAITRDAARTALEIAPDARVVGFVGQARPYKGISTLLEAADELAELGEPVTVLIAGKTPAEEVDELRDAIERCGADVRWSPGFVPDTELQTWFRASDVIALPYARVLNSGSAYLTATFGTPCVLPDEPQFRALFGSEPWVSLFDREHGPAGLAKALLTQIPQDADAAAAATSFARARTPFDMSREYFEIMTGQDR